jgi:hypothetical protein
MIFSHHYQDNGFHNQLKNETQCSASFLKNKITAIVSAFTSKMKNIFSPKNSLLLKP